jgi:ribonuclease BN (tRNA processing enzyme)
VSGDPSDLDLLVVGAGPAYTDRIGATGAAYLVRTAGGAILLDLGQGSFPRLAAELDPATLDRVLISHLHPDHFIDLVPLRHYLCYECRPPQRVSVSAPQALPTRLDALYGEPGFAAAALDIAPLAEGTMTIGPFSIEVCRVTHTDESYAFRVASSGAGAGIVYSGDCGRPDDLRPLIRAGDTLLAEVSFGLGPVPPDVDHLDAEAVGRLAASTGVGRVLLTHILMGRDPAATAARTAELARVEATIVEPGDRFTI